MRTTTKAIIIITIVTITIMASTALAIPMEDERHDRGEFYPKLTVVTGYEQIEGTDEWLIFCTDRNGICWTFYGEEEDAHIGTMFNLLMWNMGGNINEDEIIEAYYEGEIDIYQMIEFLP